MTSSRVFLRYFRDSIGFPRIRENYHWVTRIREIRSLQVHTRYLTLKKNPDVIRKKTKPKTKNFFHCKIEDLPSPIGV